MFVIYINNDILWQGLANSPLPSIYTFLGKWRSGANQVTRIVNS